MWRLFSRVSDTQLSFLIASVLATGILVLFLPVMFTGIYQIVDQGEQQHMQLEMARAEMIFQQEIENLDLTLLDWSSWDETYQYAKGENPDYVERNLPDNTFSNHKIDIILALDKAGRPILTRHSNYHDETAAELPFTIEELASKYPAMTQLGGLSGGQKGLVVINQIPYMAVARPILDNENRGPAQGILLFLRQIDAQDLQALSELYMHDLQLRPANDANDLPNPAALGNEIYVRLASEDSGAGYKYLEDLNGEPALVLSIESTRLLSIQGRKIAMIISGFFLAVALIIFGVVFFFARSLLVSRKAGRQYLERYKAVVQCSSEAILIVAPDWTIMEANPASALMLGIEHNPDRPANLKDLLTLTPAVGDRFLERASEAGTAAEFCCTRHDGQNLCMEMIVSQIAAGETPAYSLNIHNISERKTAEQALRESEERYRLLFDNNPMPIWIYNRQTLAFLAVNDTAVQNYGYSREEFLSMTIADIRPAEDVPLLMESVTGTRPAHHNTQGWRHRLKDGRIIDVDISSHILPEHEGSSILVVAQDVTRRKQIEREARSVREMFFKMFHLSPIPSALIRLRDLVIMDVNSTLMRTYGYTQEDLIGHALNELDLFTDPTIVDRLLPTLTAQGRLSGFDVEFNMITGGKRQGRGYAEVIEQDGELFLLGKFVDLTDQHRAEQALLASQVRFQSLIENAPDGIVLIDAEGRLDYISPSTERIYGYSMDELKGHSATRYIYPPDLPVLMGALTDILQDSRKTVLIQYRIQHKNGSWRWVEAWVSNLLDEPSVNAIVFNYQDITERKRDEDALRKKTGELEALYSISTRLRKAQTVSEMLPLLVEVIGSALGSDASAVFLLNAKSQNFQLAQANGPLEDDTGLRFSADRGVSGEIFRTQQPYMTGDYASCPFKLAELSGADQLGPSILVPLQSETQFLGIIMTARLRRPGVEPFTADSMNLLAGISEMAGIALRRLSLFEDAQRRLSEVQALRDIDLTIIGSIDLKLSLRTILGHIRSRLGVDAASFLMLNPHLLTLEYVTGEGFRTRAFEQISLHPGESLAGRAVMERRTIYVPDLNSLNTGFAQAEANLREQFTAYYAVPLLAKGQVKGVLQVFHRGVLDVDEEWVEFLETLAGQAAIAVDNAGLYSDLQHSHQELALAYDATIEGWSRALDLRDEETEGHARRVTEMTVRLARMMGILEADMVHVRRGALLHDIGKMGIPDQILLKPGPLNEAEWEVMRKHPVYAYQMLSPIAYLRPALDIPYCHHEKWDGTGYPRGLQGEDIPLAARLFAIADVWDAVTSDRPYRPAWSQEQALEYICQLSGQHFDPRVVEAFLNLILDEEAALAKTVSRSH